MDSLRSQSRSHCAGTSGMSGKVVTETVTTATRLTSLPPKGNSSSVSSQRIVSTSTSEGGLVEQKIITHSSNAGGVSIGMSGGGEGGGSAGGAALSASGGGVGSSFVGGSRGASVTGSGGGVVTMTTVTTKGNASSAGMGGMRRGQGSSSSASYSSAAAEKKATGMYSLAYEGSSSENSSPEYTRKEYASASAATRGRSHSRESEIRARLQSASPSTRWTELDDVKRLLKGSRSSSSSPPRSPSNTLPIPKKASVDPRSGQYESGTLDSSQASYTWASSTLPPNTSVLSGYGYQTNPNNLSLGTSLVHASSPSALSGEVSFLRRA
ncbi:collagen alpha-1(XVII) chain-like [Brienomyrus brachyistius]|uniref:collagen alpha-1(XVII) chain-like n=1 Tax=Brienomyrus brachyistius TaxID=42636 RepID=UPI0020B331AF|nr:collagen alpha-1(XVII) chain-like [Brienomyrus brachyistius]